MDAWCHLRRGLRSFSVDAIRKLDLLPARARSVAEKTLKDYFETSYGIFSGRATPGCQKRARLRFTPSRAPSCNGSPTKPGTRNNRARIKPTAATFARRITTTPSW